MEHAFWQNAVKNPDKTVLVSPNHVAITAGELLAEANQVAHGLLAMGCQRGDKVAMVLPNCTDVYVLVLATMQIGVVLVPVNWHLTSAEVSYILADSGSRAVFAAAQTTDVVRGAADQANIPNSARFMVGDAADGFVSFSSLWEGQPTTAPPERWAGGFMTYTSGTTGHPKGIHRPLPPMPPEPIASAYASFLMMFGIRPHDGVHLLVSPLYHTAVLYFSLNALHLGLTVVMMDRWTAEGMLERIERYNVTNSHMVPTQFIRLLNARKTLREYDVSSLRNMVHGAAPCPLPIKRQMLDWWGPVVHEYYAASEGGGTLIRADEWVKKPGSVGKAWPTAEIRIFDDDGHDVPADQVGTVYIKMQQGFAYHNDKEKTDKAWRTDGYFTVGDAGYLDKDGYLFLCDRKADMIISGGVNIYPAEIESVLITHPRVLDIAIFGIPDDDWGEQVKAVIEVAPPLCQVRANCPCQRTAETNTCKWCGAALGGDANLAAEILTFAKANLAKYKCPKSIDFVDEMPRDPNGKLSKRKLRDPYWADTGRSI